MCDYSLYVFRNRLAREGEELVVYRFSSGCVGLAAPQDVAECPRQKVLLGVNWPQLKSWFLPRRHEGPTAVCVPPGAQLRLEPVEDGLRLRMRLRESEDAVFVQTTADAFSYRDGLQFGDGRQILLQGLPPGQRIRVVSTGLPETESPASLVESYL